MESVKLFTMLDNKDHIVAKLQELDLSADEAKVYIDLVREPRTHLQLSRSTGINRTKIYRIAQELESRSLISTQTDDRGTFLVAGDPSTLEVELTTKTERLHAQRNALQLLVPALADLRSGNRGVFTVRTYEGDAGLKQMCWHELKTRGETLAFGNGTVEQIIADERWAAKHRQRQIAAGYHSRELVNHNIGEPLSPMAAEVLFRANLYQCRILPKEILCFDNQTIIYNDTVAIYNWKHDAKVGVEFVSPTYATMMRQLFNHYWELGSPVNEYIYA